jgi:hypothetical protein
VWWMKCVKSFGDGRQGLASQLKPTILTHGLKLHGVEKTMC